MHIFFLLVTLVGMNARPLVGRADATTAWRGQPAFGPVYDEKSALADASRWVEIRKRARARSLGALSIAMVVDPLQGFDRKRFYKVGDKWRVAASRVSHGMVHKASEENGKENRFLPPDFFDFKVLEVDIVSGLAKIEIRRVDEKGQEAPINLIQKAIITVNRTPLVVSKQVFYEGLPVPITSEFDDSGVGVMGFAPYPDELPDFRRAIASDGDPLANLPGTLEKYAKARVFEANSVVRMQVTDLFSRKIQVTWRQGDLWPTAFETAGGFNLLIAQERL